MEWNVKNALSRDVEREHLNKILKEIRSSVDTATGGGLSQAVVQQMIADAIANAPAPTLGSFSITLYGDAAGSGISNNLSSVNIPITIDPAILGIPEAPIDSLVYWRGQASWQAVPSMLTSLALLDGEGIVKWTIDDGWTTDATTDDLPEGSTNLYYTDERVYDKTKLILVAGTGVTLTPNDTDEEITIDVTAGTGTVDSVVAGTGITVDNTDPANPIVSATGGGGGSGTVTSVGTGTGLTGGPITTTGSVALDAASIASLALADTAIQPGTLPGGITISCGDKTGADLTAPFQISGIANADYDLTGDWYLWCYPSGSIELDVWVDDFANAPPDVTDTIVGGAYPAVVAGISNTGDYTSWTDTTIARGQAVTVNIRSVSGVKWFSLMMEALR